MQPIEDFKQDPDHKGALVYFELRRPDNIQPEEYRRSLPDGTRTIFIGYRADEPTYSPVTNQFAGREKDTSLYAPAPQGLYVETASGTQSALSEIGESPDWNGYDSIEKLAEALRSE